MNYLDLFSGIGGFALGAYWAGFRCDNHYFSDIEPYAVKLYQQRFPDAIPLGDICKINGKELPHGEWIITGGFPCQDISTAGKGAGLEGARSGLWFQYARIIGELRPRYAIMENVGALVTRGLDRVLGSLAQVGYDAVWFDLRAEDIGAPHKRERIWIVAYANGWTSQQRQSKSGTVFTKTCRQREHDISGGSSKTSETLADAESIGRKQPIWGEESSLSIQRGENLSDAHRSGRKEQHLSKVATGTGHGSGCCHAGWPDQRLMPQPAIRRVADGVSTRVGRLRGLGNSIVPQIAQMIFTAIMEEDEV